MNDLSMARSKLAGKPMAAIEAQDVHANGTIVIVDLKITGNADYHHERSFILRPPAFAMSIGRSSSTRDGKYLPQKDNGWFESRVVSREHAVIKASPDMKVRPLPVHLQFGTVLTTTQAVFVEDVGSMHGTFVNERRCRIREKQMLAIGDTIRFGTDVSRGPGMSNLVWCDLIPLTTCPETFPPLRAEVEYRWINERTANLPAEIRRAFEAYDDEDSDIELIEDPPHKPSNTLKSSRTFSVPDSDMSAAGSYMSEEEVNDLEEISFDEMPLSARKLLRTLGRERDEHLTTENVEKEPSTSHGQVTDLQSSLPEVPATESGTFINDAVRHDSIILDRVEPKEPTNFVPLEYYPDEIGNLTESESESRYSEDYPDFEEEDDFASQGSDRSDREASPSESNADVELNDMTTNTAFDALNDEDHAIVAEAQMQESIFDAHRLPSPTKSTEAVSANVSKPLDRAAAGQTSHDNDVDTAPSQIRAPSPSDAAMPKPSSGSYSGYREMSTTIPYGPHSDHTPYHFQSLSVPPRGVDRGYLDVPFDAGTDFDPLSTQFPPFPLAIGTSYPRNPPSFQRPPISSFYAQPYDLVYSADTGSFFKGQSKDANDKPLGLEKKAPSFSAQHDKNKSATWNKKVSIDAIVSPPENESLRSTSPARSSLKRKAREMVVDAELPKQTSSEDTVHALPPVQSITPDLSDGKRNDTAIEISSIDTRAPVSPVPNATTENVLEERPAKRSKRTAEEVSRKVPSFIKYSAAASLGFTMGIVGTFWTLVALPENFFVP